MVWRGGEVGGIISTKRAGSETGSLWTSPTARAKLLAVIPLIDGDHTVTITVDSIEFGDFIHG